MITAFTQDIFTERLYLRRMRKEDWRHLSTILQDAKVMYAYEHAFSDDEVTAWLENQLRRYREEDGLGLLAVFLKDSMDFVGQCGLTYQKMDGRTVVEIGYLFRRDAWGNGYATEAACAMRDYAFDVLGIDEVWSIIRDTNFASQNVAIRVGMEPRGEIIKHYHGVDMKHICYSIRRPEGA